MRNPVHYLLPQHSKVEEKDAHEHIVDAHPQRIALQEKEISYCRKENGNPVQAFYLLYKINNEIRDKEGEKEPSGTISIETACLPNMFPLLRLYRIMISLEKEWKKGKVNGHSYQSRSYIGNKDSFASVHNIIASVAIVQSLIEIASLEKEERHKVEAPLHNMRPPNGFSQSAEVHNVKAYHANDAKPTQKVEHMISFFHSAKV